MQCFAFLVFLCLLPDLLKISALPPRILQSATKFVYFFIQSDSFLKPDFTSSIVPRNICQTFCTFFPLCYNLFFRIFLSEYCSLVVKVSFVLFFWKFCVGFDVNFMFEFVNVIYISTWSKTLLPLPNIMYVCVVHALRVCHCKSKADLCLYTYVNSCYDIFTVIQ